MTNVMLAYSDTSLILGHLVLRTADYTSSKVYPFTFICTMLGYTFSLDPCMDQLAIIFKNSTISDVFMVLLPKATFSVPYT